MLYADHRLKCMRKSDDKVRKMYTIMLKSPVRVNNIDQHSVDSWNVRSASEIELNAEY